MSRLGRAHMKPDLTLNIKIDDLMHPIPTYIM